VGNLRVVLLIAIVAALVPASRSAASSSRAAGGPIVRIHDIAYHPARLVVHRGRTVTWRFLDPATQHTVTSRGARRFHSSGFRFGGTFAVRFRTRGTYRYSCRVHGFMRGTVVVR
jgi:plastocyanin